MKAQFESSKHLHKTPFEISKYYKTCFETVYLGEKKLEKLAQDVTISLSFFIFPKNHNELPKVAQLVKKLPDLVTLCSKYTR
jgi:hypothetical protein